MQPFDVAVICAVPMLTLADLILHWRWAVWGSALVAVVFIVRQAAHVARPVRRTSVALLAVTAVLLPLLPAWMAVAALERGVRIGVLIASLLVAINLLSLAVARVPRARDLLESLHHVSPRRRYGVLSVASQFFGGLLGLAGIAMMMESAARQENQSHSDKLSSFSAVTRGYAAVSLWSPMYSNMSIVLAMYAGAHWADVLPVALAITLLFVVLGVVLDRLLGPQRAPCAIVPAVPASALLRDGWPVLLGMLCFLSLMVFTSRGLDLPISAVIIAGTPAAAWLLNAHLLGGRRPALGAAGRQVVLDRKSTRLNSSHIQKSRMPSSA